RGPQPQRAWVYASVPPLGAVSLVGDSSCGGSVSRRSQRSQLHLQDLLRDWGAAGAATRRRSPRYSSLMKTLGIVGGIGPESTIEYYRFILDGYRARVTDGSAPHLLIDSLDVNRGIAMLDANDTVALTDYLSGSLERLVRAGAEIALIAANTPHLVFDEVQRRT